MKLSKIFIFTIFFTLLASLTNAEEKKLKFRGSTDNSDFKQVEINISKDFLNVSNKYEDLNFYFDAAENFSLETTINLK